jgi:hypothetical protein
VWGRFETELKAGIYTVKIDNYMDVENFGG